MRKSGLNARQRMYVQALLDGRTPPPLEAKAPRKRTRKKHGGGVPKRVRVPRRSSRRWTDQTGRMTYRSDLEVLVADALDSLGYQWRWQVQFERFRVDFLLEEHMAVLEVDRNWPPRTTKLEEYHARRDGLIQAAGYQVAHIHGRDVYKDAAEAVFKALEELCR